MFATPQGLGFDLAVQRHYSSDAKQCEYFVFKIEETTKDAKITARYFKMIKCLSGFKSLCITGRTTHVWLVEEVNSVDDHTEKQGEPQRVLKDMWLNAEAKTEKQIQDNIFSDVDRFIQNFEKDGSSPRIAFTALSGPVQGTLKELFKDGKFKRHFLTICCDGQGYISKARAPSARPCPELLVKQESTLQVPQNATSDASRCRTRTHEERRQWRIFPSSLGPTSRGPNTGLFTPKWPKLYRN